MQDIPINNFGPFLLLQFSAAVLVLGGLAFTIYRATRDRKPSPHQFPQEQRLFFDGPVNSIIGLLKDIRDSSRRIEDHVEPLGEELRNQTRELAEIKRSIEDLKNIKRGR